MERAATGSLLLPQFEEVYMPVTDKERASFEALPKKAVVDIIRKMGAKNYTMEVLEQDIKLGFPLNPDGTVNMWDYAAWLYDCRYLKKEKL